MHFAASSIRKLWQVAPFALFLGFFLWALNAHYPMLGHDFTQFIGYLIAGRWHFHAQWFLPFRFTPHFCGGMPQYGNPQDIFYSIHQLFALFLGPWIAAQAGMILLLCLGYFGWMRFGRDVLRLNGHWAHVAAMVAIAHGFILLHLVVGHLTFATAPLIGLLLWLLFDRRKDTTYRPFATRTCLFAISAASIIYSGGFHVAILAGFSILIFLPIDLLSEDPKTLKSRCRMLALRFMSAGLLTALLCASKLVAIWSFMRFFPRLVPFDTFSSEASALLYLFKALWGMPQQKALFTFTGSIRHTHELSLFLSPVVLPGLLFLLWKFLRGDAKRIALFRKILLACTGAFFLFFFLQLARGEGLLVTPIKHLPIFSSMAVTTRYLYPFSLLIGLLGVMGLAALVQERWKKYEHIIAVGCACVSVLALAIATTPLIRSEELQQNMRYDRVQALLQEQEDPFPPLTEVKWGGTHSFQVLRGTSNIHCYETIFGYDGEDQITDLQPGPARRVTDGFFNLLHPACLQYPEENDCQPGDKIAASDYRNFDLFRRGERTWWHLSLAQHAADWMSLLTLLGSSAVLGVEILQKIQHGKRGGNVH